MVSFKRCFVLVILLNIFFTGSVWANEDAINPENFIVDQLDKLNTTDLQQILDTINGDLEEYIPKIEIKTFIIKVLKGEGILKLQDIVKGTVKYFFKEVVANWRILGQIIVLAAIYAI